jgi:hypothetical protein
VLTARARQRTLDQHGLGTERGTAFPVRGLIRRHTGADAQDTGNELRVLEQQVAASSGKQEAMALLARLLSPEVHHTTVGLMATRMYTQLFDA